MVSTIFKNEEILFLKGYLKGKGFNEAIKSLNLAEKLHYGVTRKSGEPYISHPCRIANAIISLGINDEDIICAVLLHDILEDTDITESQLLEKFNKEVVEIVKLVTKVEGVSTSKYYEDISKNYKASIVKMADRCHNVSTMYYFDLKKMEEYIIETEERVLPLCSIVSNENPILANPSYYMKYHLESILETAKYLLKNLKQEF